MNLMFVIGIMSLIFSCQHSSPDRFMQGDYRMIHDEPYVCIQPDRDQPWKETCRHVKTGEVVEIEKSTLPKN